MSYTQSGDIVVSNSKVFIKNQEVELPNSLKRSLKNGSQCVTNINGTFYLNGYKYLGNNKWKKTLMGLFYKWF